ncbi:hypothetical protein ACFLQU_02815 [Verrucomicrobiota bacterium]
MARISVRKRIAFAATIACAWLAALYLGLELWAQLRLLRGRRASEQYTSDWRVREVREAFHRDLWIIPWLEYKPGSSVEHSANDVVYRAGISSLGFRGNEIDWTRTNMYVIACLGGSTMVCGNTDSSTCPALLQKRLDNGDSGAEIEVVNCGICGLRSVNYERVVNSIIERIRPNMVVEYNAVNDICWGLLPIWKERLGPVDRLLLKSRMVRYFFGDRFLPDGSVIVRDIEENIIHNLREVAVQLRRNGVRFAVSSFVCPRRDELSKDQYAFLDHNIRHWWRSEYVSYTAFCRIVEIYNMMLENEFEGSDVLLMPLGREEPYPFECFVDICHMTDSGIERKAGEMANLLGGHLAPPP